MVEEVSFLALMRRKAAAHFVCCALVLIAAPLSAGDASNLMQLENVYKCLSSQTRQQDPPTHIQVTVGTRLESAGELLIGFNPSYLGSKKPPGDFSGREFQRMLAPPILADALRFPPGTYANFFDWQKMALDEKSVKKVGKRSMLESITYQKKLTGGAASSDLDSFMEVARANDVVDFMVLNLYTRPPSDAIRVIQEIKKRWPDASHWELGNELSNLEYLITHSAKHPWDEQKYIDAVEEISVFIRSKYPADKVGVVGAELFSERYLRDDGKRMAKAYAEKWDAQLKQNGNFDSIIFHPYIHLFKDSWWTGVKVVPANNSCGELDEKGERAVARWRWMLASAKLTAEGYARKMSENYRNKKVWVTEVGLIDNGATDYVDWKYGIARSIFNIYYFLQWLDLSPALEVYMFHVLSYGKSEYSAFHKDFSFNANTVSYAFINEMMKSKPDLYRLNISGVPRVRGVARHSGSMIETVVGVVGVTKEEKKILLINAGADAVDAQLPWEARRVVYFSRGLGDSIKPGEMHSADDFSALELDGATWRIPPFSISMVTFR